ncbi:MAG: tRNA adenosine(34) deaminase TadA [Clostridia bacterium]|nr:tRNA adenosine(34) deaminase TadA [Clostridia bacterium]
MNKDEVYMQKAIQQAEIALKYNEVPVGAVIVYQDKIIARGYNKKVRQNNTILHAEIVALQKAMKKLGDWRLNDATLYVTLEPCPMCAGACINARVGRIVFGAYDPKAGCCGTLYNLPQDTRFNHRANVCGGVLEDECAKLLVDFFAKRRLKK